MFFGRSLLLPDVPYYAKKRKTYFGFASIALPFLNYNWYKNKSFFCKFFNNTTLDFGNPSKPIVATVTALTSSVPPRSFIS
jgi:hypothetical protein